MTSARLTGRGRGGNNHPVSVHDFILEYLGAHGEANPSEMHRAFCRQLEQIAEQRQRKRPYHHPSYNSFYKRVAELKRDGLVVASGRQEETVATQFDTWDEKPMKVYYRLA